jgi:hypothetical protein
MEYLELEARLIDAGDRIIEQLCIESEKALVAPSDDEIKVGRIGDIGGWVAAMGSRTVPLLDLLIPIMRELQPILLNIIRGGGVKTETQLGLLFKPFRIRAKIGPQKEMPATPMAVSEASEADRITDAFLMEFVPLLRQVVKKLVDLTEEEKKDGETPKEEG